MWATISFVLWLVASTGAQYPALDAYVRQQLQTLGNDVIGLSVVGVKGTDVVWSYHQGQANPRNNVPVTQDTLFVHASVSKTIIAYGCMILVEKGYLNLDEDINKYLDFPIRNPNHPTIPITTRQLMTHMSTINDEYYSENVLEDVCVEGDSPIALGVFLMDALVPGGRYYGRDSWHSAAPGDKYDYSNLGSSLAAYVAEVVAQRHLIIGVGSTFNDLVRAQVYQRLGAPEASFSVLDLHTPNIAIPSEWERGRVEQFFVYGYPDYPDGRFIASPTAQAQMLINFINFGTSHGVRILHPQSVEEIRRIQPGPPPQDRQGLFWHGNTLGGFELFGHSGGDDGISTEMWFHPPTNVGYVLLTTCYATNTVQQVYDNIGARIIQTLGGSLGNTSLLNTSNKQRRRDAGGWGRRHKGRQGGVKYINGTRQEGACWWMD